VERIVEKGTAGVEGVGLRSWNRRVPLRWRGRGSPSSISSGVWDWHITLLYVEWMVNGDPLYSTGNTA